MRIGLISTAVPLVQGGYRFIVEWLKDELIQRGHVVEIIYLPCTEELVHILPQMAAFRMIKLDAYFDRIITFRPPSHLVRHPCKVVWFIHHIRFLYDLWQSPFCPLPDDNSALSLRKMVHAADHTALAEAHRVFTNSITVSERVRLFNGLDSEVLYPPVADPKRFRTGPFGDEIVAVCRMEPHKRQHLLVEALACTQTPVRLRLCGSSMNAAYVVHLRSQAEILGVSDRLTIEDRWISEDEKSDLLATALASAYVPFDEDSYGYPTIEAAHARRCTITVSDAGGVQEFVEDGRSGLVSEPQPSALANAMDRLFADRKLAAQMGIAALERVTELSINWDIVVARLLA